MTKTTKRPGHTDEQVARGWLAIERLANGNTTPLPASERIEIGSANSGFDAPPAYPAK